MTHNLLVFCSKEGLPKKAVFLESIECFFEIETPDGVFTQIETSNGRITVTDSMQSVLDMISKVRT